MASTVRPLADPTLALAAAAAAVMALAQIAIPLAEPLSATRATLTTAVVVAFAATTTALAAGVWGWARALAALAAVVVGTWALEWVGSASGWPFGAYDYTDALSPRVAGVPVAVVLAWFAMAVPAREVAARLVPAGWATVLVGAVALTAWDVMLDPQMVGEGYWVWEADGPWRGIPLSNYAGWLVSATALVAVLQALLPRPGRSLPLLGLYTWWAVMQTLGFVAFFGDPLVGVVGGAAMLPLPVLAWRRQLTARRSARG